MTDAYTRFIDFLSTPKALRIGRHVLMVLIVCAIVSNGIALRYAIHADQSQREGRQIAAQTTCAALGAVIDAGRATIRSGGALPRKLERFLEGYGYPSREERKTAAELAAASYARAITTRVQTITGRSDLVRRDGSLDCARLREVSQ